MGTRLSSLVRSLLALAVLAAGVSQPACAAAPPTPLENPAQAKDPAPINDPTPLKNPAGHKMSQEKQVIRSVLADPVFGGKKTEYEWRYTGNLDTSEHKSGDPSWLRSLLDLMEFVSKALRALVWVGLAVLIALVIYFSYRYRDAWLGPLRGRAPPPEFLFGLDVRPESLPDDVAAAALAELAGGNAVGALSLLYRGALVSLIHRSQLDFHAGHTEGDCLQLVRKAVDTGSSGYFAELLDAWKRTAYGHDTPPAPVLEALCTHWRTHFVQVETPR